MEKAPLRTKTMKTTTVSTNKQEATEPPKAKARTPSPKQEAVPEKARTPTPQQEALRTPSPKADDIQEQLSFRPPSQDYQCKKSPSPTKLKSPDPPASPAKSPTKVDSRKEVEFSDPA